MIALSALTTLIVSSFLLIASPDGIKSDFDLHGLDFAGTSSTMNDKAPAFRHEKDSDSVELSFVSPMKGVCVVAQAVLLKGEPKVVIIKRGNVNKGATQTAVVTLIGEEEAEAHGATINGYTIFVSCGDEDSRSTVYSSFYHVDRTSNA